MSEWPSLSRFKIRALLGVGGSGKVYLAQDLVLAKEVALKLVPLVDGPESMLELERSGASFQEKLAQVCPQVAKVFGTGEDSGFFWIAMEYVEGEDLAEALRKGPLPEKRAVAIAIQLCEFLEVMQDFPDKIGDSGKLGAVHGDLKPENIRLQRGDRVKVIDFGIAKQLSISRPVTEQQFGTLFYASPERVRDDRITEGADLWALSVLLYYMISGHLPFQGHTVGEVRNNILEGNRSRLSHDQFSREIIWIINLSLSLSPSERFKSPTELRRALLKPRLQPAAVPASPDLFETKRSQRKLSAALPLPDVSTEDPVKKHLIEKLPVFRVVRNRSTIHTGLSLRLVVPLAVLVFIFFCGSQWYVSRRAEELDRSIQAGVSSAVTAESWRRYDQVAELDFFSQAKRRLTRSADRILEPYVQEDAQVGRIADWERALRLSAAAQKLDPGDLRTEARVAYCNGHLQRLSANKNPLSKEFGTTERELVKDAVESFQKAAAAAPDWPDPHVALAAVHSHLDLDLRAMESAIDEAESLGYRNVRRFTEYRAEGYRRYGWSLSQRAARSEKGWQKRRSLEEGIQSLKSAIDLYRQLPQDDRIANNRAEAEDWLEISRRRFDS